MSAYRSTENGQNSDEFEREIDSESASASSHFPLAPSRGTSQFSSSNGTADKTKEALLTSSNQQKQVKSEPIDGQCLDGYVDSEASIPSQMHSKSMKNDEDVCNESMNPSIQTMPPHQIGQSSSIPATNPSEFHQESNVLKRKSDFETTLLSSSVNMKKVKIEEIFDETVHKAKEIKTVESSIQSFYLCQNVHKYWFNAMTIRKDTDLEKQIKWLQNTGLKNGFEPRYISSELMRIKCKEPKVIQRFCVTSKKEAVQVRKFISSQNWVKCFCLSNIKSGTASIWDFMRQEDIVIPSLIASKAWNDNERDLEMDEMAKRCQSNDSIRMALSDLTVIRSVRKGFDTEASAQLDQLCDELNVQKDLTKLKMSQAAKRRQEKENEEKEREFNANFR